MRSFLPVLVFVVLLTSSLAAQNVVGDFECQMVGDSFAVGAGGDCEGWSDESLIVIGVSNVAAAATGCPGMPSQGNQYAQIFSFPVFNGPSTPSFAAGNTSPLWPFTAGNISILSKTTTATSAQISVEWALAKFAGAANYFAQILIIDPATDQVIAPLLVTDSSTLPLFPGVCAPVGGGPFLDASTVQTATATLPASVVGQTVKIAASFGQVGSATLPMGGQFLEAALFMDNLRFDPPPPAASELILAPNATVNFTNPAGPGTVTASGTIAAFRDPGGVLVTDPAIDPIVGASFSLTGNLVTSGPDLDGGILAVTTLDFVVTPGSDALSVLGQFNHDAARDLFGLGGSPQVIPFVDRPLDSAFIANATRLGSGSSVLDALDQSLSILGSNLALVFEVFPGQPTRLDRLVLDYAPHPQPPVFNFETDGFGSLVLGVAGADPADELYNVFVVNPTLPQGTGPFFGLEFTPLVSDILALPLGTIPFHVAPDANGAFFWGIPSGSIPPGLVLDGAAGTLDPSTGSPTWVSPVIRRSF